MILRMLMSFLGEENFLNGIKVVFARQIVFTLKMLLSLCRNKAARFNLKQIILSYLALEETFKLLTLV